MIIVHMLREWQGPADVRGDAKVYPQGWTGEMGDDEAGYCIARGIASAVGALPEATATGVEVLRQIIAGLEELRIEPTCKAVYDTVAKIAAQQQQAPAPVDATGDAGATAAAVSAASAAPSRRARART